MQASEPNCPFSLASVLSLHESVWRNESTVCAHKNHAVILKADMAQWVPHLVWFIGEQTTSSWIQTCLYLQAKLKLNTKTLAS